MRREGTTDVLAAIAKALGLSLDDLIDYRLENDPAFLARITVARKSLAEGRGTRMEDL